MIGINNALLCTWYIHRVYKTVELVGRSDNEFVYYSPTKE